MPVRRHEPVVIIPTRSSKYDTRHDYGIDDSIHRADYLSNAILEDTYDAATRSRGKDYALLRDIKSAIRPSSVSRENTPNRTSRYAKRFRSLPPVERCVPSSTKAVVPYRPSSKVRDFLSSTPPTTSLLSSRINSYLRGSSLPPYKTPGDSSSTISYRSLLPRLSPADDVRSRVPYKPLLSDTSSSSPLITRSANRLLEDYALPSLSASYRLSLPYAPKVNFDNEGNDDDEDYEPETSYRRKYKIVKGPAGSAFGSGVRRIGEAKPALTYPSIDEPEDSNITEDYADVSDSYAAYSSPRPSRISPVQLSSYDGDYDGSYDADMAEMYDYVPFGPSRQGILELTENEDSSLYPSLTSIRASTLSAVPLYSKHLDQSIGKPSTSSAILDSLLSSTAARAKKILADSKLPDYKNASLVFSVEGSAVSEDGKNRYGFKYYPPPIPLKGSHIGLDERILGVAPKPLTPADSFLSNYLNKLRDIRTEVRDHVDRGDYARGRSVAPVSPPSYVHRTVHMPVTISGQAHSVPVSSYRSRLGDGQSHRVDVFPLVVSETTLPKDKKLHLPVYRAAGGSGGGERTGSPNQLTVLEKINIKVSTEQHVSPRVAAVSRRVRASTVPPTPRPYSVQQVQSKPYVQVADPLLSRQSPAGPVLVLLAPSSRYSFINSNLPASKPVVLSQAEAPWYLRARAGSVPPQTPRSARATSLPPRTKKAPPAYKPPEPLPTSRLRAHAPPPKSSEVLRNARARSLEPSRRPYLFDESLVPAAIPSTQLWAHRPVPLRKDAGRLAKARNEENRRSYPETWYRAATANQSYERASDYYPPIRDVDAKDRAFSRYLYAHRGRFGPDSKPPRPSLGNFPQVYVPWSGPGPSNRSKAAIIGSRLEAADGGRKLRKPRSEFAANKLRELKREEIEEGVYYRTPSTSSLQASKPPLPKTTERKAIRDLDGFTKPRNLLSWQYRVESTLTPDDLIYQPSSYIRLRESVRDVQEKMDRQKQLLDRYLGSDFKIASNSSQNVGGSSVKIPAYYAAGGDPDNRPVSDLRRRLRRTLAKAKNNPNYYRE